MRVNLLVHTVMITRWSNNPRVYGERVERERVKERKRGRKGGKFVNSMLRL